MASVAWWQYLNGFTDPIQTQVSGNSVPGNCIAQLENQRASHRTRGRISLGKSTRFGRAKQADS